MCRIKKDKYWHIRTEYERWFINMKKTLAMLLSVILCYSVFMSCAQADSPSNFIGYWEVQNVGIGGRTYGADYLGVKMTAVVHNDGILIVFEDNEMTADYINGYGNNYYVGDGDSTVDLTYDSQGRIHLSQEVDGYLVDIRMRRTTAPRIDSRMRPYVGDWKLTAQDAAVYGDLTMTLYNDGFGVIVGEDVLLAVRMGMQAGKFCLVDNEGLIMPITQGTDGSIAFTIVNTNTAAETTLHMER